MKNKDLPTDKHQRFGGRVVQRLSHKLLSKEVRTWHSKTCGFSSPGAAEMKRFNSNWARESQTRVKIQSAQIQRWTSARQRVQARADYNLQTPTLEPLPEELRARGEALLRRPDVIGAFASYNLSVGMANLQNVLSFQKNILADGVERVSKVNLSDPQALFATCLPDAVEPFQISGVLDNDGKAFSISSTNPNLRIMGGQLTNVNGQPFYGFTIGFGFPFVQVVEYQGRWFIRDGYHRSFGLLKRGVDRIPCFFIRAQDAQQFGGTAPDHIRGEILFGAHPPFLKDFLDDEVSASATRPLIGKVLRIAASEFNIHL